MRGSQAIFERSGLNTRGTWQNKKVPACPHGPHRPIKNEREFLFRNISIKAHLEL